MIHKFTPLSENAELPMQGTWLLVQGEEEFLKRTLVERLRARLLAAEDSFNFDLLDVAEKWEGAVDTAEQAKRERMPTRADRVLVLAQALPFLGSGRLVLVRNVDLLATEQQKRLAAGLATVPPMNHVLLSTGSGGAGKKAGKLIAELQKGLDKHGTIYDCSPLTLEDAEEWVRATLRGWGQAIEPGAARLLLTRTGTELQRLRIEVDKLSLMAGDRAKIRLQDVELLTPKLAEETVFHLTDAVASRDAGQAMSMLRDLIEVQLEPPQRLFPMIVRQFRLIWQAKVLLDAGWRPRQDPEAFPEAIAKLPEQNVVSFLKGWMGPKLAAQARQFTWPQLTAAYRALLDCDMAGKAIEGVPRQEMDVALEMLCVKLCRG